MCHMKERHKQIEEERQTIYIAWPEVKQGHGRTLRNAANFSCFSCVEVNIKNIYSLLFSMSTNDGPRVDL